MRPEALATVTHGLIHWRCHYCHANIEGPGIAALRLEDVRESWNSDTPEDTPGRSGTSVTPSTRPCCWRTATTPPPRHHTAGAVQEAVAHDEGSRDVYRISLNELCTVPDVAFHTHHTIRPHGWLADTGWLTVIAGPVGLTHPDHADPRTS